MRNTGTRSFPRLAFSLLEILVAMGVLSIMMVFLFNLSAQTILAWESGARRIEAAQAARVGIDTMARELQVAFGGTGVATDALNPGATVQNNIPFFAIGNGTQLWGLANAFKAAPASAQIFSVAPLSGETNAFGEIGFMCVYVTGVSANEPGYHNLRGYRYYLLRHSPALGKGNFFYRGTVNDQWITEPTTAIGEGDRIALIPNCYNLTVSFATNNNGVLEFVDAWPDQTVLPAGVMVTAKIMDEKTAARVEQLKRNGLDPADIAPGSNTTIGKIVRQGTVEVRRFIPFVNAAR